MLRCDLQCVCVVSRGHEQGRSGRTQEVDVEVSVDSDDLPIFHIGGDIPRDDSIASIPTPVHLHLLALHRLKVLLPIANKTAAAVLDSDFVVLVRSAVEDEHSLVAVLLPCEHLRGGVHQVLVSHRIIADVDLTIASVKIQRPAQLRNLDIPMLHRRNLQLIRNTLDRVVFRMPRDIKLRRIGRSGRDGDRRIVRERQGGVMPVRTEEGGGDVEEVGLKLDFAVLFAPDLSFFGYLGAVVIRGEAVGVAEVAPVRASEGLCGQLVLMGRDVGGGKRRTM